MATFQKIVLAVYYQELSLLIIPMLLETNLFEADENDWYDVKPRRFKEVALKQIHSLRLRFLHNVT